MDDKTVIQSVDRTILEEFAAGGRKDRTLRGWLTIWSGIWKGRDFPMFEGRNFVGSDESCGICIPDIRFSDFSFNIRIRNDQWTLIDLDSDSGVIVNEKAAFRKELGDEDWIKTGNTLFRIKKR